jgi:hypothetical protein
LEIRKFRENGIFGRDLPVTLIWPSYVGIAFKLRIRLNIRFKFNSGLRLN